MRHPTGRPFLYFLAAGALLLVSVALLPVLHASATTLKDLFLRLAIFVFVPFIFVPHVIFHIERHWIRRGSLTDALATMSWTAVITMALLVTALSLAWLSLPSIIASRFGPPRSMTDGEAEKAIAAIRAWDRGNRGDLSVLLAQLTWRWLPNEPVNAALLQTVRNECGAAGSLDYCFQGLRALFAVGAQSADLAPVLVRLSERDAEVRANWKPLGFLLERGEIAHQYRSMFLDMLGLLGPAAADTSQPELVARLSDPEERSRWAAAGALDRLGAPPARSHAAAFFARNVAPLIDTYRVDRSRRMRACLFLLRTELNTPEVGTLAVGALDDEDGGVSSCGAFLLLTSGVAPRLAEERLVRSLETHRTRYAQDSFAAALEILATPRARQTVKAYTAWQPERIQRIKAGWTDRYFRLFGELF